MLPGVKQASNPTPPAAAALVPPTGRGADTARAVATRWRRIALPALLSAATLAHAAAPGTLTAEHLAACASCHGANGEGRRGAEYYPHLAGKPAGYLAEQLRGFRDGRRANATMRWMVRYADDAYLDAVARYYAAQPARERPADGAAAPLAPAEARRAQRLVAEGRPTDGIPACKACHGDALEGTEPGIPALLGLPPDYVIAQFGAWQSGTRAASAPDCMAAIANRLEPAEVRALAGWLARQPHAGDVRPRARVPLPARCGTMEGRAP